MSLEEEREWDKLSNYTLIFKEKTKKEHTHEPERWLKLAEHSLVPSNHDKLQPPITLTPWKSDSSSALSGDYTYKYFFN